MSASTKPDKAFHWISETWKEDQSVEALREVAPFATLDAKLLSSLTNIRAADFARTIVTRSRRLKLQRVVAEEEVKCC